MHGKTITASILALAFICLQPIAVWANDSSGITPEQGYEVPLAVDAPVTSDETTTSGPDSRPESTSEKIEIIGYEIYNLEQTERINTIQYDTSVTVVLRIKDTREGAQQNGTPVATLNTTSFRPVANGQPNGDAHLFEQNADGSYALAFPCTYLGEGSTFGFDLSYTGSNGLSMQYVSLTLNQCNPRPEAQPEPEQEPVIEEEPTVKGTGFVLKEANFGDDTIFAGTSFTLNCTALATNGDYSVENVSVTLDLPAELTLSGGQSVLYIGTVRPGGEVPIAFTLVPAATAEPGSYTIKLNVQGISANEGEAISAEIGIPIPIHQPDRFELSGSTLPKYINSAYDDGSGFASITLTNKGKTTIYNVTVGIASTDLYSEQGEFFVGNISGGSQGYADINIRVDQPGSYTGTLLIQYENALGEQLSIKQEFNLTAENMGMEPNAALNLPSPAEVEGSEYPTWLWLLLIPAIIVATIVLVRYRKKHKVLNQTVWYRDEYDEAI